MRTASEDDEMTEEKFKVTGMSCAACSSRVEKAVKKLDGTDDVSVNLLTGTMEILVIDLNIFHSFQLITRFESIIHAVARLVK